MIYDTKFETMSGGYEDNGAVATHIWDSLAQDQRINTLEEATFEQQPLPNLHRYWLSPEEKEERDRQVVNDEVTRRLHRRDADIDPTTEIISEITPTVEMIPDITPSSDSESEEDRIPDHIPRRHKPRSPPVNRRVI